MHITFQVHFTSLRCISWLHYISVVLLNPLLLLLHNPTNNVIKSLCALSTFQALSTSSSHCAFIAEKTVNSTWCKLAMSLRETPMLLSLTCYRGFHGWGINLPIKKTPCYWISGPKRTRESQRGVVVWRSLTAMRWKLWNQRRGSQLEINLKVRNHVSINSDECK